MIKCCLQPTQSSLLFKKVPLSIFETFATSFTRSFTRFFASKQFSISSFVSQFFTAAKFQVQIPTQPSIPSPVLSKILHGMSLGFKPFPLREVFFLDANARERPHILMFFISSINSELVDVLLAYMYSSLVYFSCDYQTVLLYEMIRTNNFQI